MTDRSAPSPSPEWGNRPEGFCRVAALLATHGHPFAPQWLDTPARTCAQAAALLGLQTGQIAKSVIFKRRADALAVLVVAAGDMRVDEAKVAARVGAIGRADAAFVKQQTGFSIGGVAPVGHQAVGHSQPPLVLIDQTLLRFAAVWAAAGHPNAVFCATPAQLVALTGAPVVDVVADPAAGFEAAA